MDQKIISDISAAASLGMNPGFGMGRRLENNWRIECVRDGQIALMKSKRLFILKSCRGILDEIGTYSREVDEMGQPTEKIKDKETFHRLDALRYAVLSMSGSPTGGIWL